MANKVMTISGQEGWEKPTIFVMVFGATMVQLRASTWGILDGHPFFDTHDGIHVELFGGVPYMIQTPAKGYTIDENGRHRELHKEESAIIQ